MEWIVAVLVVIALGLFLKIYTSVKAQLNKREKDFDERLIARMRQQGADPFRAYAVDFFFALPSEAACQLVARALESEGFRVDVKPVVTDSVDLPFSLHATKALRLSVPEMKDFTQRFGELAGANGGRYDGWMPGPAV